MVLSPVMRKGDLDKRPGIFRTWKEARPMLLAALVGSLFWTLALYHCAGKE